MNAAEKFAKQLTSVGYSRKETTLLGVTGERFLLGDVQIETWEDCAFLIYCQKNEPPVAKLWRYEFLRVDKEGVWLCFETADKNRRAVLFSRVDLGSPIRCKAIQGLGKFESLETSDKGVVVVARKGLKRYRIRPVSCAAQLITKSGRAVGFREEAKKRFKFPP